MIIKVLKKSKQWYWKIVGRNGKTVATSETYSSLTKAEQTAQKVFKGEFSHLETLANIKLPHRKGNW